MAINIKKLTQADIGKEVKFIDPCGRRDAQYGNITSFNNFYIFVDYCGNGNGVATYSQHLEFENKNT